MKNKKNRRTNRARSAEKIYNKRTRARVVKGVFYSNSKGGVFFEIDKNGEPNDIKYFVDLYFTCGAMNGDTVEAKIDTVKGKAEIISITERATKRVIGTLVYDERYEPNVSLEPEDSKLRFDFAVVGATDGKTDDGIEFSDGDKAEIEITCYPEFCDDQPEGRITRVFGKGDSVYANYQAILYQSGITVEFSSEAMLEAESAGKSEIFTDGRLDLREQMIFTLDGADAKDLDDAISVEKCDDGYILGVHIADVSNYVTAGSALDRNAYERGTSVYFTDKVVPMLPTAISNGICSLNVGVDRYALSAFIYLDKFGEIKRCELKKSVINSKIRGVYSEFNDIVDGAADEAVMEKYSPMIGEPMDAMLSLYRLLKHKNERRGALELDSRESLILLDEAGIPADIISRERGEGEKLIEQFMLCANEAVAMWLSSRYYPCIYRVHEAPDREKVSEFLKFIQVLGINPGYIRADRVTPMQLGDVLEKAKKQGLGEPISYMLLRTMSKAKYSENDLGHFGLSSKCYCHFTAPIRRYPDLAVHRIISAALENGESSYICEQYADFAKDAAKRSSENELKALEAEREIEELYKCIFMKSLVGEVLEARVSSVTSFGLFCMTEKLCEGLVPIHKMRYRAYYDRDSMTIEVPGKVYRLGDKVMIKVESVDVASRKVDFILVED